jgi:hypothetical protein
MQRNRVVSIMLVTCVLSLGLIVGIWWLFLATPAVTDSELNATTPDYTVSTAPQQFEMRVEVESRSLDDNESANWSAGVLYDRESQQRLGWLHSTEPDRTVTITQYQRYSGNHTHNYIRYHNSEPKQFSRRVRTLRDDIDTKTESIYVNNESQTYTYYREGDRDDFEVMPDQIPPLGFLHTIPYRYVGTRSVNGTTVEKYEPVDGWTEIRSSVADDGPDTYISDTSGQVYVSPNSKNIIHIDVTFRSTRTDVRAGRWFGNSENRIHISLSVQNAIDENQLKPEWVSNAQRTAS